MYAIISKRSSTFKRLVGVSLETFGQMVEAVQTAEIIRLQWETRWRDTKLSIEDQVLLCMMYLRSYTTYLYLWAVFWVSESNAQRKSIKIENILIKSWLFSLPKKDRLTQQELETIIIDATEVQIERPKHKQKRNYSGKKKKHTVKAQIVISKGWEILRANFARGKVHDKKLFDQSNLMIHPDIDKLGDSWYQGIQELMSNVRIPKKASKLHPLSKEDKNQNKELSSKRILVENKICQLKVFDILDEKYRNKQKRFWLRFNLICWIVNHNNWFWKLTSR